MNAAGELDVMGVLLTASERAPDSFALRARVARAGVTFQHTYPVARDNLELLLQSIEAQFHDFTHEVSWDIESGLWLRWTLDPLGHAVGRFVFRTDDGWLLRGPLTGDQSYLPQLALGLRVALGRAGPN